MKSKKNNRGTGRRSLSSIIAASLIVPLMAVSQAGSAQAANDLITLNSDGGTNSSNGIRVGYQSGRFQVWRNGSGQIYNQTSPPHLASYQISLAIIDTDGSGNPITGSSQVLSSNCWSGDISCSEFDAIDTVGSSSTGSGSFTSTLSGTYDGRTYSVQLDVDYTAPQQFFTQKFTVTVPDGNTKLVRLYTALDSYLDGGDRGPGFYNASPAQVGVVKGVIQAFQHVAGSAWEGYYSGYYETALERARSGRPFDNTIDTSASTDNGYGVNWNFGNTPGVKEPVTNFFAFVNAGTPQSPTIVDVTPVPEGLDVEWEPSGDGPTPDSYVASTVDPDTGETVQCTATYPATSCTIWGLDPSREYEVTVVAVNGAGAGTPSTPSNPVTPLEPAPPNVPGTPTAAPGGPGEVVVTVTPPIGGGAPTSYTVTSQPGGKTCTVSASASPLRCTVSGLTPGANYTFTVTATNAEGTSGPSASASSKAGSSGGGGGVTKPGKPTKQKIAGKPNAKKFKVSWSKPAGTNAQRPVTGYKLTVQLKGKKKVIILKNLGKNANGYTLTRTALIKALKKAKYYSLRGEVGGFYVFTVKVAAKNAAGYGTPSNSRLAMKK